MSKLIVNCETGEETLRELTKAEKDQQKVDEANIAAQKVEADAKATAKQAIADRLGLTADELKTLLG
jgi:inosine/xanthosine triphosphate pyrophosphatase family protein